MSLIKKTPPKVVYFMNFKCDYCKFKPSDFGVAADSLSCPNCESKKLAEVDPNKPVYRFRKFKINDRPENVLRYYENLQKVLDEE